MDSWHLLQTEQILGSCQPSQQGPDPFYVYGEESVLLPFTVAEVFFHAQIPSFSCSGTDLTSSSVTRGRLISLKSLTGSPAYPGQACSRTLIQTRLHAFVSWDQILKGLGRFLMHATAGILRTEVWTCENTFLVPYACECCALDVAEVGQSKEQCQQHGSPSTVAVSLCPCRALASRCQQAVSSSTGRLFNLFAMWGQRNLMPEQHSEGNSGLSSAELGFGGV